MTIWGGSAGATGARYDPALDAWSSIASDGAPVSVVDMQAVWTGNSMFVWGPDRVVGGMAVGGRYDPVADDWMPVSTVGAPLVREAHGRRGVFRISQRQRDLRRRHGRLAARLEHQCANGA